MRKLQPGIAFVFLVIISFSVAAQNEVVDRIRGERISVLPFINQTGVEDFDKVADSITDALNLILRWSGQYDVRDLEPFNPFLPDGRANMARRAREQRMRVVVFGRLVETAGGRIELEAAVYGTDEGRILGGDRKEAFGAFDLVEAADELVLTTTSALLGYPVELGAVILNPSRGDIPYHLTIDGVSLGENVRTVPQVLVGRRTIEIVIRTVRGEMPVYLEDRLIRSGEALEVNFALPAVTRIEQEEVTLRHGIASRLLSEPRDYLWALEALSESRQLLARTDSPLLEPLREEQARLHAAWELNQEFSELTPRTVSRTDGTYTIGDPLAILPVTARIRDSRNAQDPRVEERVRRNGYALYHLVWLRWGHALTENRWQEAERILSDLQTIERHYQIGDRAYLNRTRGAYMDALRDAETMAMRRRRPWPYLALGIGFGGVGFGSYMYATDEVSNYAENDRNLVTWIQWGSIGTGVIVTVASLGRIVTNNRAGEVYLREWVREHHGHLMNTAERVFAGEPGFDDGAYGLVLGPVGEMITIGTQIEQLPALVSAREGRTLPVGRATIVSGETTRLLPSGLTILAVK